MAFRGFEADHGLCGNGVSDERGEAIVRDKDDVVLIEEDIGRFQVSMWNDDVCSRVGVDMEVL